MDELMSEDELAMDVDIPEPAHIETILDGMGDSIGQVAGTESLTNSQIYLGSVLAANGYIRRNQVGQEGFMSKVGDGFKAALAYVKKIFTNIWDFFFKRDQPKLVAEAKEEVKKAEEILKAVESGGSSEQETTQALTNMRKVALALSHEPDTNKAALDQILKEADEAMKGDQAKKKAAVLSIGRELPKLNKRSQSAIKKRVEKIVQILKSTEKVADVIISKGEGSTALDVDKKMAASLKSAKPEITGAIAKFEKAKDTSSVADLKDCYTHVSQTIDETVHNHKALEDLRGVMQADIKSIESGDDAEAKKGLTEMKSLLSSVSAMVQCGKEMIEAGKALLKAGNKSFGY